MSIYPCIFTPSSVIFLDVQNVLMCSEIGVFSFLPLGKIKKVEADMHVAKQLQNVEFEKKIPAERM